MIRFEPLKNKPAMLNCLTGLTLEGFMALLPTFEAAYLADVVRRDAQRSVPRQRERGAGQKGAVPGLDDKLVFILFYFRVYPVQLAQGFFFGMGQPQANEWIHRLSPILRTALGYDLQLPARSPQDIKAILETCPGLEFIIDGTERPIRRPQDKARQKANYSGKKKRHTIKNNVVTDKRTGKIKGLSPTVEGKRHDKKVADDQHWDFPPGSKLWQDTGFQGYHPQNVNTFQPTKKPKGRELTPEEKLANTAISQDRIPIEHTFSGVKAFRIVHDVFRNVREGFDDLVMEITCGLHNFRLDHPMTA
jgi:DDE superfamily endonuclease/Helix-turn-helix of DDE superfamily endonuclease